MFATDGAPNYSLLSEEEREGLRIFSDAGDAGCVNCHRTIAQVADRANNIGLDVVSADTGAGGGCFKPPSGACHLAPAQRDALVAFLNTLTDPAFLRAERFSNPFPCRSAE